MEELGERFTSHIKYFDSLAGRSFTSNLIFYFYYQPIKVKTNKPKCFIVDIYKVPV